MSGPNLLLSPTSLIIILTLTSLSLSSSNAVVLPCLPLATKRFTLSPNLEKVCLRIAAPISSAIVNKATLTPSLARQYATFAAFPPLISAVGTPRMLPPPSMALSLMLLKNSSFDPNFITRSTKKSGITTMGFI